MNWFSSDWCLIIGFPISLFLLAHRSYGFYLVNNDERAPEPMRILGGRGVDWSQVPFFAQVRLEGLTVCGASIISENWLVSAAHCFDGVILEHCLNDFEDTPLEDCDSARLDIVYDNLRILINGPGPEITRLRSVCRIFVHPKFDKYSFDNDVALVQVDESIEFDKSWLKVVNIAWAPEHNPKPGDLMTIIGTIGEQHQPTSFDSTLKAPKTVPIIDGKLHLVEVPMLSDWTCKTAYRFDPVFVDRSFCAGDGTGDACQGDSGGPAIYQNRLVGLVSSGQGCANLRYPGVYVRLQYYANWISNTTGIDLH